MKTGFGWVQAKPACSMVPVAVTPDELGSDWRDGRIDGVLYVRWNNAQFGEVPTYPMQFGFDELVAHAARTRDLCAGTIIGSGTISSPAYANTGSCYIAERRAIEMITRGAAKASFMQFGEQVSMTARLSANGEAPFGTIDQCVINGLSAHEAKRPSPPNSINGLPDFCDEEIHPAKVRRDVASP
jgi:fumarylacetoacetate (FAA) hydrolase